MDTRYGEESASTTAVLGRVIACLWALGFAGGCSSESSTLADAGSVSDGGSSSDVGPVEVPTTPCESPFEPPSGEADTVIGDGSAESCTEEDLRAAVQAGGVVGFDCGEGAMISITSPLVAQEDLTLLGGGDVTLSGQGTRILRVESSFERDTPLVTIVGLNFEDGESGSGGDDTEVGGGAIYRVGGRLHVFDSTFQNNRAPRQGQDVAGGAIYSLGGEETVIVRSTFTGNEASNGGAIGVLHSDLHVYESAFVGNRATGSGGNPGNGGNGGAIYSDGVDQEEVICGTRFESNRANAFGGAFFRVCNAGTGTMDIRDSDFYDNHVDPADPSLAGGMYMQGVALTMEGSAFRENSARGAGGVFIGPNTTLSITNSLFYANEATESLGGGLVMGEDTSGAITNTSFIANRAPGEVAFAGATVSGQNVVLTNSLFADNEAGNGYNPITCLHPMQDGGGNIQWPVERSGEGSDEPDALCAAGVLVADPDVSDEATRFGDLPVGYGVSNQSPARGHGQACPEVDMHDNPRDSACTAGALE